MSNKIRFTHPALTNEETGKQRVFLVEAETIVCPTCNGRGRHFRSDLDENNLVESMELDGDEDGLDAYHGGAFDQRCTECKGRNVVDQVNWDKFRKNFPEEVAAIDDYEDGAAEDAAYAASERRYLGGY